MQPHSSHPRAKERRTEYGERARGGVIRASRSRKRSVSLRLAIVARRLRLRFDQRAEQSGITRAQWSVLAAVARNPGTTQRRLADLLSVSDVTAGRMIDRLCIDGFLERRENPGDRRAYLVDLTDKAKPVLMRLGKVATIFEEELFAGFSDEDLARLDQMLGLMARNLTETDSRSGLDKV